MATATPPGFVWIVFSTLFYVIFRFRIFFFSTLPYPLPLRFIAFNEHAHCVRHLLQYECFARNRVKNMLHVYFLNQNLNIILLPCLRRVLHIIYCTYEMSINEPAHEIMVLIT